MSFRDQLKACREACGLTRAALAEQLGVSASAVGNYETGVSFPKEDVLLRLFDALRTDPNQLFCGSYRSGGFDLSGAERTLLEKYRSLSPIGRDTVRSVTDALCDYRDELTEERGGKREPRLIPLYNSPPPRAMPRRCSTRTLPISPRTRACRAARTSPCAFRATPWSRTFTTRAWSTSTATRSQTAT